MITELIALIFVKDAVTIWSLVCQVCGKLADWSDWRPIADYFEAGWVWGRTG